MNLSDAHMVVDGAENPANDDFVEKTFPFIKFTGVSTFISSLVPIPPPGTFRKPRALARVDDHLSPEIESVRRSHREARETKFDEWEQWNRSLLADTFSRTASPATSRSPSPNVSRSPSPMSTRRSHPRQRKADSDQHEDKTGTKTNISSHAAPPEWDVAQPKHDASVLLRAGTLTTSPRTSSPASVRPRRTSFTQASPVPAAGLGDFEC